MTDKKKGELIKVLNQRQEYECIQTFSNEDQLTIIEEVVSRIMEEEYLAYPASRMLVYASEEVASGVLQMADYVSIVRIMKEIKLSIKLIGHRLCDFYFHETTFISRMRERMKWLKLYYKCYKYMY